ncbi:16480_t:CDS:1, partial [Gigaspora margarita]
AKRPFENEPWPIPKIDPNSILKGFFDIIELLILFTITIDCGVMIITQMINVDPEFCKLQ